MRSIRYLWKEGVATARYEAGIAGESLSCMSLDPEMTETVSDMRLFLLVMVHKLPIGVEHWSIGHDC